jgi:hypothetical protein
MLRSIGIKDGIVLYHIGYNIVLGCPATNGVIGCGQPTCWLTNIGLVSKFNYIGACCIGTPTWVTNVLNTTSCKKNWKFSFIYFFNLSSTKAQFLNSCPTYWQYSQVNAATTVGWVVRTSILHWINGCSMVFMKGTFGQTCWWSGCVCWTTTWATITSTNSTCYWKLDWCEGLHSKLHNCSTLVKNWLHPKIGIG